MIEKGGQMANTITRVCRLSEFGECGETFETTTKANALYCPSHRNSTGRSRYGYLLSRHPNVAAAADAAPEPSLQDRLDDTARRFLLEYSPLPSIPEKTLATRVEEMGFDTPQEGLALFSDLHYYSRIDKRVTGGLAEYNIDIARERLARWRNGILRFTQMSQVLMTVNDLHIFAMGDELEGHGRMFPSQALQMSESLLFQIMGFVEDMSRTILDLLSRYEHISIYKVPGNHGRLADRARQDYTPDNAELLAWEIIGERLRSATGGEWAESETGVHSLTGGKIDVHIFRSFFAAVRILGWLCVARHGHGIKGLDATYTGALDNKFRLNAIIGEVINYYFKGHLHEAQSAEAEIGGEIIQNGCFVGPSLLSLERSRAAANRPSQEFLLFHPMYGKTHHHRIHLATVEEMRQLEVL